MSIIVSRQTMAPSQIDQLLQAHRQTQANLELVYTAIREHHPDKEPAEFLATKVNFWGSHVRPDKMLVANSYYSQQQLINFQKRVGLDSFSDVRIGIKWFIEEVEGHDIICPYNYDDKDTTSLYALGIRHLIVAADL